MNGKKNENNEKNNIMISNSLRNYNQINTKSNFENGLNFKNNNNVSEKLKVPNNNIYFNNLQGNPVSLVKASQTS